MPMLRTTLLLSVAACTALSPASRRDVLRATPAIATGLIAAPALAEDFQASLKPLYKAAKTAKLTYRSKAGEPPPEAWAEEAGASPRSTSSPASSTPVHKSNFARTYARRP